LQTGGSHNILDVEEFEGACLTPRPAGGAADIFHSRLEASLDGKWLLSNGWVWTPWRGVFVYDVERALAEPSYLSTAGETLELGDAWESEVEGATFVGHRLVCVTNEDKAALTIYDLDTRKHERLIELAGPSTGVIVDRWDDLYGGGGICQPNVSMKPPEAPWLATDPAHSRFALGGPESIIVVSLSL
jgi:hypothetical protein